MKKIDVADCSSQSDRVVLTFSEEEGGGTVSVSASADHPFFVFGQGWSSPHPPASRDRWHTHTCGSTSSSGDTLTHVLAPLVVDSGGCLAQIFID